MIATDTDTIHFYRANEKPYGCFSNLYRCPVEFEGERYPTAEHAYQAGKPRSPEVRWWLMLAPSPSLLAMAAHGLNSWDITPGWSKNRRARMRAVVEAKFRQNANLAEILLSTGDKRIAETATVDNEVNRRWGEVNGRGSNWLGLILMEVREALRSEVGIVETARAGGRAPKQSDSWTHRAATAASASAGAVAWSTCRIARDAEPSRTAQYWSTINMRSTSSVNFSRNSRSVTPVWAAGGVLGLRPG